MQYTLYIIRWQLNLTEKEWYKGFQFTCELNGKFIVLIVIGSWGIFPYTEYGDNKKDNFSKIQKLRFRILLVSVLIRLIGLGRVVYSYGRLKFGRK